MMSCNNSKQGIGIKMENLDTSAVPGDDFFDPEADDLIGEFLYPGEITYDINVAKDMYTKFNIHVGMFYVNVIPVIAFAGKIIETIPRTEKRHMREPDSKHRLDLA